MEARLAGPCPAPNSEREKKFQKGIMQINSLYMLLCKVYIQAKWPIRPALICSFHSMKQLSSISTALPLDEMLVNIAWF